VQGKKKERKTKQNGASKKHNTDCTALAGCEFGSELRKRVE
jgi:hypothetical protein